MVEWWQKNLNMYVEESIRKTDFVKIVFESRLLFRDGIKEQMEIS